jgi:hypothetical protein
MVLFQYCFAEKIVLEQRDNEMNYFLFNVVRLLETSSYFPSPGNATMPEQAGHTIVRISQLRQQKPGLLLSCTKKSDVRG